MVDEKKSVNDEEVIDVDEELENEVEDIATNATTDDSDETKDLKEDDTDKNDVHINNIHRYIWTK